MRIVLAFMLALFTNPSWAERPATWSSGPVAAGTAAALEPVDPVVLLLPELVAQHITGDTALFYFSPTCPHCQQAMPEVIEVAKADPSLKWLGIATGSSTEAQIAMFKAEFGLPFAHVIDRDATFSRAVGARSTPSVFLARPAPADAAADSRFDVTESSGTLVQFFEAYTPFGRGMGPILLLRRDPTQPFAHFQGYQGDRACAVCHTEENRGWMLTHHAVAYRTLYMRERESDLQCVGCHVTGWQQPGGFEVGDHGSALSGVTCEACHGASGPHDGARDDPKQACASCHDADHSIAFTVEKGLPHIDHWAANGLDDDTVRLRMQALADGEAARPLLAFPTGPTLGAAACRECHKPQHKWAKKGVHANAMSSLTPEDALKVECVQCHATPVRMGAADGAAIGAGPTRLEDLRTAEGVSCESCHGPGGDHVENPRVDNIVGLGESCPECVIEAICTSCHTPKWDPSWDLEKRMDAVDH